MTTGLLKGLRFVKDNRLLPRGFDKASADADIAVRGDAAADHTSMPRAIVYATAFRVRARSDR